MSTYFTYQALESQRASGYRNTTYALAELVDNSLDAGATTCKIIFIEKRGANNRKSIDEIIVADDGEGMSHDVLADCLKFGGGTNFDIQKVVKQKKIGKFGFGLPNASLSQCPSVRVYSWKDTSKFLMNRLILKELKDQETIELPGIEDVDLPEHYKKVGAYFNCGSGTIVSWTDCDRLSNSRAETIVKKSEELLGKIYRHLLSNEKKIELKVFETSVSQPGKYVETLAYNCRANDPLFLLSDTVISSSLWSASKSPNGQPSEKDPATYYSTFVSDALHCKPTNVRVPDHCYDFSLPWKGKDYDFTITTSVAHEEIQKPGIREGGDTIVGKFYKKHERECISFVRAQREIAADHFGFYNTSDPRQRWWGIEISFSSDADELLGVHNNKQGVEFEYYDDVDPTIQYQPHGASLQEAREHFWSELTQRIERARKAARKEILAAHKKYADRTSQSSGGSGGGLPGPSKTTTTRIMDTDGKRAGKFSDAEKASIKSRLKEKYPDIDTKEISLAVDVYDGSLLPGCMLYCPSESEKLWDITDINGSFLIILVNTNHQFYLKMIEPLKTSENESSLAAVELFIASLAFEEWKHFIASNKADILQEFRSYVGLHLNRYLREFENTDDLTDDEAAE